MGIAKKRIEDLVDYGSFVEIGENVMARFTDFSSPVHAKGGDGIVTGYATMGGKLIYIYSQESSSMGGSLGEMHGRKIVNLYNLAMKSQAPIIGILDCSGIRVEEGLDGLNALSKIYKAQAKAVGVIPQIAIVSGICGGGISVLANMADFLFVDEEHGKLFVNSQNFLNGQELFTQKVYTDAILKTDELNAYIKKLVEILPSSTKELPMVKECKDDLNRELTDDCTKDTRTLLKELADNHRFIEIKAQWGGDMVAGLMRLNGAVVGVYGNDGISDRMTAEGIEKANRLVRLCDRFNIPVLTVTDTKGYDVTIETEMRFSKSATALIRALAQANVPKVNLITGDIYGSAYSLMNSKGLSCDLAFMWDTATVNTIDSLDAVAIMYPELGPVEAEKKAEEYSKTHCSPQALAKHGYVDKVISPKDTRKYVIGAFEAFANVF